MSKAVIAIVGRPNVGKSTFFNRCVGQREAIVYDSPGVTRDRIYRECDWSGHELLLIDTGGLLPDHNEEISKQVKEQVKSAVEEADLVLFMVDGKAGLTGADEDVANMLRRIKKPVVLAVNKIDDSKQDANLLEFYSLGIGEPHPVSALRGTGGVGDLLDSLIKNLPIELQKSSKLKSSKLKDNIDYESQEEVSNEINKDFSIAMVGRPNVGKSSLINAICGKKRAIVTDIPGTTRDAIDTAISFDDSTLTLIDTAGIRRKSKVDYGIEAFSVVRALKSIERADVVILVLDANETISAQDQKIAQKIIDAGKAVVVVFNKWDLINNKTSKLMNEYIETISTELAQIKFAEVIFVSAHNKQRITKIIEACQRAYFETQRRISTATFNSILSEAQILSPPPSSKRGKRLRVYYGTQVSTKPPAFALFVNDDKLALPSYMTYLERKIRESYGFKGTPIRLFLRPKKKD